MNGLAICAGIGGLELGISLALGPSYSTVCYIEREAFPASVLVQRMDDGILAPAPIWSDLATFDGRPWSGCVDIISAGIPCQPFSAAGKRRGIEDERWIWEDVRRLLGEIRPGLIFLENVPGIVGRGLEHVLGALASLGYSAAWDLFRASDCSSPQKRERWFLLADSGGGLLPVKGRGQERRNGSRPAGQELADADRGGLIRCGEPESGGVESSRGSEPHRHGLIRELDHPQETPAGGERELPELADSDRLDGRSGEPESRRTVAQVSIRGQCLPPYPPGPGAGPESYPPGLEPSICRTSNGLSNRVQRLRALGNGVVPGVAALAFRTLLARLHGGLT